MGFKFSKTSRERMAGVDGRIIRVLDYALQISPIDFGIPPDGGLRSADRQKELYLAGKSKCDGYERLSDHQYGMAIDFYAWVGKASWDVEYLAVIASAILQMAPEEGLKGQWGGFYVPRHDYHLGQIGWDAAHVSFKEIGNGKV